MISRLTFQLDYTGSELNYNNGSVFQGVLMEFVNKDYGEILHMQTLKPYSQYIEKNDKGYMWVINTLTDESKKEIIDRIIVSNPKEIFIKHSNIKISVTDINLYQLDYDKLIKENYINKENNSYLTVKFITPTAFKSNSKYIIYPDIQLIFKSLINKYNLFSKDFEINDEEILDYIVNNAEIIDYNLRSTRFYMEGIRIPSFIGRIRLKLRGTTTTKNLVNLLLDYGQYSGIGIKNAIGMGAIKIEY